MTLCLNTTFIKLTIQGKIPYIYQYGIRTILALKICLSSHPFFSPKIRFFSRILFFSHPWLERLKLELLQRRIKPAQMEVHIFDPLVFVNSHIDAQLNPYFIHRSLGPTVTIVTQPLIGAIN